MFKKILCIFILLSSFMGARAQYWFGPKVGIQYNDFVYQEPTYEADSFDVSSGLRGQYGLVLVYQASEKYAVHAELFYESVNKEVRNRSDDPVLALSNTRFNYLTLPFSLRWNFGKEPLHFYIAGGPRLSYWLGGSGEMLLQEFNEDVTIEDPINYKVFFNQSDGGGIDLSDTQASRLSIVEANRIQYGLQVSTGAYIDIPSAGRILIDLRYSFGHSNMGFNGSSDFTFINYEENFEFRNNSLSISLAYLFEYDVVLQRKGSSTNKLSKNTKGKKSKSVF